MRLEQYLTEDNQRVSFASPEDIAKEIKGSCSKFFSEFKGLMFYRGIRVSYKDNEDYLNIIKSKPHGERRVMNMSVESRKKWDDEFKKRFGWKPRSSGVFTNTTRNPYIDYGHTHYFFPIGDYKYVYNPDIDDLYMAAGFSNDENRFKEVMSGFKDKGLSNDYKKRSNYNGYEVVWKCKEYYLVSAEVDWHYNKRFINSL